MASPTLDQDQQVLSESPTCRHHWLIEPAQGATSKGRCKLCGHEREFSNVTTKHALENTQATSGSGPVVTE